MLAGTSKWLAIALRLPVEYTNSNNDNTTSSLYETDAA